MSSDSKIRNVFARIALSVGLVFVVSGVGSAEEPDDVSYLSPQQIYEAAEGSPVNYSIASADDLTDVHVSEFARVLWPTTGNSRRYPWVESSGDGSRIVTDYDLGVSCQRSVDEADRSCNAGRYDEATRQYTQTTVDDPDCYIAYARLGDCLAAQSDDAGALTWFEQAIERNPFDFRVHFELANSLFRLGRLEESRAAYARALALSPHDGSVMRILRSRADELGVRLVDRPFAPRAFARQVGPEVAVFVDGDDSYWTIYGLCKGLWIGEPGLRKSRTGSARHSWSLIEEQHCLLSMFENYIVLVEDGMIEKDPGLERIFESIESETLDGFVLYEIAYRVNPHITLRFPLEKLDEVVRYVSLHVLVADPTDSAPGTAAED